jgi:addiction module HigA family antidote
MATTTITLMFNPPHPGEFITETYLEPFGLTGRKLASRLRVSPSTLARVLNGSSRVTPEMALRLAKVLGRSAESWLAMQAAYDLWIARQHVDVDELEAADFATS